MLYTFLANYTNFNWVHIIVPQFNITNMGNSVCSVRVIYDELLCVYQSLIAIWLAQSKRDSFGQHSFNA